MGKGFNREDCSIDCPYYEEMDCTTVTCAGGLVADALTITVFNSRKSKEEYVRSFCQGCYQDCPLLKKNDKDLGFVRPRTA